MMSLYSLPEYALYIWVDLDHKRILLDVEIIII